MTEAVAVWTDADRLAQVFINLISNAQKYCDAAAPELAIFVRQLPGRIEVDFIDNGHGIPAQQRALIFEKFARADTARGAPGAGLGLAISREIMTRLGGGLTYMPSDSGVRFRVRLPARALRAA
jgi:signal transduction histidine kinase